MAISQFGSQEWLAKQASLPPRLPSMTVSSSTAKNSVWWSRRGSSSSAPESASALVMRTPVYSRTRVPLAMGSRAKTPRPWMRERRTITAAGEASVNPIDSAAAEGPGRQRLQVGPEGVHLDVVEVAPRFGRHEVVERLTVLADALAH